MSIRIEADTKGVRFLGRALLKHLGVNPALADDISLVNDQVVAQLSIAKVTAGLSLEAGSAKLTIKQVTAGGIPIGGLARRKIRQELEAKINLGNPIVTAIDTPDANTFLQTQAGEITGAEIRAGLLAITIA